MLIQLAPEDNVAVATVALAAGTRLDDEGLVSRDEIPSGHKIALRRIAEGEKVLKFGVPIGSAVRVIMPGEHVHVHNIKSDYITNDFDHADG